jgi:hypothetical protein
LIIILIVSDGTEAEGDVYNLQRIRSSTLGQSAPSLTANSVVSNFDFEIEKIVLILISA